MSLYERLELLYERRHHLVHEISFSMVGPPAIRDMWSLDEARGYAANVVTCIRAIEALITEHTPSDFPNRLSKEGYEESILDSLTETVAKLEKEITEAIAKDEDGLEKWNIALAAQRAALQNEIDFIEVSETLRPVRYYDVRDVMKEELLRSRLTFLLALKVETGH
jgi:hypothetical protein